MTREVSQMMRTASAFLYGAGSLTLLTENRILISRFFYDFPIVMMMWQQALALATVELLRICNVVRIQPYTFERGKDMFIPSLLYSVHSYFSMLGLEGLVGLNLPMLNWWRRCAPLIIAGLSVLVLKVRISRQLMIPICITVLGSMFATSYGYHTDWWSVLYGTVNLTSGTIYMVMIQRLAGLCNYGAFDIYYMNCFNTLILSLIHDLIKDEIRDCFMYIVTSSTFTLWFNIIFDLYIAAFTHFMLMACIVYNSALSTSMVSLVRASFLPIVTWVSGLHIAFDKQPDWYNWAGIAVTWTAYSAYVLAKRKEERSRPSASVDGYERVTTKTLVQ